MEGDQPAERSSCLQEPPETAGLEQRGLAHPGRKEQAWVTSHLNHHDKPLKSAWPGFKLGSSTNVCDPRANCSTSVGLGFLICKKWDYNT